MLSSYFNHSYNDSIHSHKLCDCCLDQMCCVLLVRWSLLPLHHPATFCVSSADGTFKMLMPEMYCRALQKYFKVRRKEAKGTDAEQVLKEV